MAQPGRQMAAIQPNQVVTIDKNGDAKPGNINVVNGDVIEFQTDKNNGSDWVVQFQDVDGVNQPLTTFVAGYGGTTYLVVKYVSGEQTTIPFDVTAYLQGQEGKKREPAPLGKYTITINSGGARKKKEK